MYNVLMFSIFGCLFPYYLSQCNNKYYFRPYFGGLKSATKIYVIGFSFPHFGFYMIGSLEANTRCHFSNEVTVLILK